MTRELKRTPGNSVRKYSKAKTRFYPFSMKKYVVTFYQVMKEKQTFKGFLPSIVDEIPL